MPRRTQSTQKSSASSGITWPKLPFQWQQVPGRSRIAGELYLFCHSSSHLHFHIHFRMLCACPYRVRCHPDQQRRIAGVLAQYKIHCRDLRSGQLPDIRDQNKNDLPRRHMKHEHPARQDRFPCQHGKGAAESKKGAFPHLYRPPGGMCCFILCSFVSWLVGSNRHVMEKPLTGGDLTGLPLCFGSLPQLPWHGRTFLIIFQHRNPASSRQAQKNIRKYVRYRAYQKPNSRISFEKLPSPLRLHF